MNMVLRAAMAAALCTVPILASAETRDFDLEPFDAVAVTSGVDAEIAVGGEQSVRAEARDGDILDKLRLTVRDDKLEIEIDRIFLEFLFEGGLGEWLAGGPNVTVYVTVPELTEVDAHAGSDVTAEGMVGRKLSVSATSGARLVAQDVEAGFLAVDASSGASAKVVGSCDRLEAETSSGARLQAEDVTCEDVRVQASSGGQASVHATVSVDAAASSGGGIDVWGRPDDIEIDTNSGGDVDFRR